MNPIRIGLIGLGRMGGFFLEELRKSEKWEVASICDISPESRARARELAPEAKVIADEQEIFDDPTIQAVGLFALADSRKFRPPITGQARSSVPWSARRELL